MEELHKGLQILVPVFLLFNPTTLPMHSFTILIYWLPVLGVFLCADEITKTLRSTPCVFPALVVTIVGLVGTSMGVSLIIFATRLRIASFNNFGLLVMGNYPGDRFGDSNHLS